MVVQKKINRHFEAVVLDWNFKQYFLVGGYGSSKSYHIALKILLKLLTEKRTCLVVRNVYATIRDSCYNLFQEIAESLSLNSKVDFKRSPLEITFYNGSRVIFRGMDKPAKLKSINDISLIWIEEAAEISYTGYKELLGRLRHPFLRLHIILSTNPVSTNNWVYQHFFTLPKVDDFDLYEKRTLQVGDVFYHHSTVDDNRFLPHGYLEQLNEMKEYDPDLYRIARWGRFGVNGVRVLPNFEILPHNEIMRAVEEIPRRYKFAGLDFGFVESYNACVRCAVDKDNKTLYIYWEWYERGLTDDQIVNRLEDFIQTRELIRCDSAEPKTIKYLQKNGINAISCKKFAGSVLYNIRKLKRFHKIFCSDACTNAVRELADLTFAKDKDGNLIEDEFNIDSHIWDALAYAVEPYDVMDIKFSLNKSDFGL